MSKCVIVLGMHRSGTSLVAGILAQLGIDMGKRLLGANAFNPTGYWENVEVVDINTKILQAAGGNWKNVPSEKNILKCNKLFSQQIKQFISSQKAEFWGFKDPRLCLTVSLWSKYLKNAFYVVVFRNPVQVAQSLNKRDGIDIKEGLRLTAIYNDRLTKFIQSTDNPCLFLSFERIYPATVREIINFLKLRPSPKQIQKAEIFIDPELKYL